MKDIIIVGASGFGMEVLWLARRLGRNIIGFLDDTTEKQNKLILGVPVLGAISECSNHKNIEFIVAIGSPRAREHVVSRLLDYGVNDYATLIDPTAIVDHEVSIGSGSIVCAGVICTVNVSIGKHTIINLNSTVGHEVDIGDYVTIAPNVSISGNINLKNLVEVGTGATLREKLEVGYGSVVGMGSVLTKDIAKNKVVVGNPARVIKSLDQSNEGGK
ncbi:MAG: acetyltransferase [Candidatus Polarisedimenticolaceae bacterium]|nr:acetyltransferase [Candidatus Polarisedimenticolaceae bacterium]